MSRNFGNSKRGGYGSVIAGIHFWNEEEAAEALRAVEAAMRAGMDTQKLRDWRIQLMNMRYRAWREDWAGWA